MPFSGRSHLQHLLWMLFRPGFMNLELIIWTIFLSLVLHFFLWDLLGLVILSGSGFLIVIWGGILRFLGHLLLIISLLLFNWLKMFMFRIFHIAFWLILLGDFQLFHMVEVVIKVELEQCRLLWALELSFFWLEELVKVLALAELDDSAVFSVVIERTLEAFEALLFFTGLCLID